jgi:hypothetical protein
MEALLEVYIVRIYRREEGDDPCTIAGTVEIPGDAATMAFAGIDRLLAILNRRRPRKTPEDAAGLPADDVSSSRIEKDS